MISKSSSALAGCPPGFARFMKCQQHEMPTKWEPPCNTLQKAKFISVQNIRPQTHESNPGTVGHVQDRDRSFNPNDHGIRRRGAKPLEVRLGHASSNYHQLSFCNLCALHPSLSVLRILSRMTARNAKLGWWIPFLPPSMRSSLADGRGPHFQAKHHHYKIHSVRPWTTKPPAWLENPNLMILAGAPSAIWSCDFCWLSSDVTQPGGREACWNWCRGRECGRKMEKGRGKSRWFSFVTTFLRHRNGLLVNTVIVPMVELRGWRLRPSVDRQPYKHPPEVIGAQLASAAGLPWAYLCVVFVLGAIFL